MQHRYVKLILRVTICVLAVFLFSCSHKRKDFEAAKTAVAQELRSPGTAQFCTVDQAEFSAKDAMRTVKLWVDNQNLAGVLVRTHFEVTIDPKSGLVKGATCLECAAEDEKQKLNEAVAELQALTSPPTPTPAPR
jgi:predicted rRNA methylase YqxC with S4 and FtsJ domains